VLKLVGAAQTELARARLLATFSFVLLQSRPDKRGDDCARERPRRQTHLRDARDTR
jgi:hypothetical protein